MIDLDTLRWRTLTKLITDFKSSDNLRLLNSGILPVQTQEGQTVEWDIVRAQRDVSTFEGKHDKSSPRAMEVVATQNARMIRTFKSILIPATILTDLRNPGSLTRQRVAESRIARETLSIRNLVDRQDEFLIRTALLGGGTVTIQGLPVTLDYKFQTSHLFAFGNGLAPIPTLWDDPTADIIGDITRIKTRVAEDSGYGLLNAYCSSEVMAAIMKNEQFINFFGSSPAGASALATGSVSGLMGLNWIVYDGTFKDGAGVITRLIPKNTVVFCPAPDTEWGHFAVGSDVVVNEAKQVEEVVGAYAFSKVNEDPPSVQLLGGKVRLPIISLPDALATAVVLA